MKYHVDYEKNQEGGYPYSYNIITDIQNAVYSILRLNNGAGVLIDPQTVNLLNFNQYLFGAGTHVTSPYISNSNWVFSLTSYGSYWHLALVNDNGIRPGMLTNNNLGFSILPTYVPTVSYITPPGTTLLVNQPVVKYKVDYDDEENFDDDYDIEESVRKVNKKSSKKKGSKKKGSKKKVSKKKGSKKK